MKRRKFIQSSLATLGAAAATSSAPEPSAQAAEPKPTELYELRAYSLKSVKQPILDRYLSGAFIPALKRYGIGPVGAFVEQPAPDQVKMHMLIVYPSAEHFT